MKRKDLKLNDEGRWVLRKVNVVWLTHKLGDWTLWPMALCKKVREPIGLFKKIREPMGEDINLRAKGKEQWWKEGAC